AVAVVVVLLLGVGAAKAWTLASNSKKGNSANRNSSTGHNPGAGTTFAGGGGQTGGTNPTRGNQGRRPHNRTLNKTGSDARLKIPFDKATYQTAPRKQVRLDLTVETLGDHDATNYDAPMKLGVGGGFINSRTDQMVTIPSGATSHAQYIFDTNGPVNLASATV